MGRLTMGIATVIATLAISASAASATDVPASKLSAGKYQCSFYPAGDGISAGAPVQDSTGTRVGYLNHGANWIVCQASGATVHTGVYYNRWWGYTEANDHKWGWVNAIWGRGGDNDQGFAGVPNCHGTEGYPPGVLPPKPKPKPLPENMVVLGRCAGGFGVVTGPCKNMIKKESGIIRTQLPGRLDGLYSVIRSDAPHAKVVIVGYPYLFYGACDKSAPLQWLNPPTDLLDSTIKAAAQRHGFTFVDLRAPFKGHSACDEGAWINHLYTHDIYKSFHLNAAGYREVAKLIEAAL